VCNQVLGPDPIKMMEVGMSCKGLRVIGIDVGKRMLDVAREGVRAGERYSNDVVEIARFVRSLDPERDIVVFERSGGYERLLEGQLAEAGIMVAVMRKMLVKLNAAVRDALASSNRLAPAGSAAD